MLTCGGGGGEEEEEDKKEEEEDDEDEEVVEEEEEDVPSLPSIPTSYSQQSLCCFLSPNSLRICILRALRALSSF